MKKNIKNIIRHADLSEKSIEKYLVQRVKELGGICLKYSNPNAIGYPDRLVLLPGGWTRWVELKSKGEKPTKVQTLRHRELEALGHCVYVVDSREEIDVLVGLWRALI